MKYVGKYSPWGQIDHSESPSEGVHFVSTPGHGGIKLEASVNKLVPETLRTKGGWYEEDCEYAIAVCALPYKFSLTNVKYAVKSMRRWYPEEWEYLKALRKYNKIVSK